MGQGVWARVKRLIFIGLGANLSSPEHGPPQATLEAALVDIEAAGPVVVDRSRWYRSRPQPPAAQPWFVNGVAILDTGLAPLALMALLLDVERHLGRRRGRRWGARVIDLDLLAYNDRILRPGEGPGDLILPHPRLHERAFVLRPLAELAPHWRHPQSGLSVAQLLHRLGPNQIAEPLDRPPGVPRP